MIAQFSMPHQNDSQESKASSPHQPVMLSEVMEYLRPVIDGVFVDGTLGMGGHARALLNRIGRRGRLIAIDRDAESLAVVKERLADLKSQCTFVHDNYKNIENILKDLDIESVDGILLDLGISSFQLNNPQRGFAIRADGPLDMRLDRQSMISAYDLVNSLSEHELSNILKEFGQERWHYRIARRIVETRSRRPIATTQELSGIILSAMPKGRSWQKIHPATRAFQALRIAVNCELESLEVALKACLGQLKPGGRLVVIAFHSLEDRVVKLTFKAAARAQQIRLFTKKPLRPTEQEIKDNPRARSARLRIAERL